MIARRKKILLLLTSTLANGGIQRFNRTLLAALQRLDTEFDVLSLQEPRDRSNTGHFGERTTFRSFGGSKLRYAAALASASCSGRYDLIVIGHINLLRLTALVTLCDWRASSRLVLVAHGIEVWNGIDGFKRLALRRLWRILCVSNYTKRRIREQSPHSPESAFVIFPNALDQSWVQQDRDRAMSNPLPGLPERFILSVTRLDPAERYKGLLAVLEALGMIEDQDIHYVIAGSGKDASFLSAAAFHMGVGHRVHFVESLSDAMLTQLYQRCLAFVLPSGKEGFGIVYLEAMFFGAPVIAAREKGVLDVVTDGETGLLVDYGDVIGLAKAIHRIVNDSELRHKVCAGGSTLVTGDGKFTFAAFTDRLSALLDAHTQRCKSDKSLKIQPARIDAR